jgi:hypothetical protein
MCSLYGEHGVHCEHEPYKDGADNHRRSPMEIYVHRRGESPVELRTVEETTTVSEAVGWAEGEAVWIEDTEVEVEVSVKVADAGIKHRGHVHVNRCRQIAVEVNFNGAAKERRWPPPISIGRVFEWATEKHGFNLSEADRAEHTLQLCGSTQQPDAADHIGSFVTDECSVCFDLVPKHRFEG